MGLEPVKSTFPLRNQDCGMQVPIRGRCTMYVVAYRQRGLVIPVTAVDQGRI